jgi:ABC-2 type transport system ATP-binding protein
VADSFGIISGGRLIDEFTIEELGQRCGKYILLKTGDAEKSCKVLSDGGISKYDVLGNGDIKINEEIDDTSKIVAALVGADIAVYELVTVQSTLEQYYLNCTGGNVS